MQVKMINRRIYIMGLILLLVGAGLVYGGDVKLAQTGFQFLSVGSNARGSAMANALTTVEIGSAALQYNPAGMARQGQLIDLTLGQNQWIDGIKYNSLGLSVSPYGGRYGVLGLSLLSVDYGEVQGTMVWGNSQGYIDTDILTPTAFAAGVGYAKSLTNKFAVGGQVKVTGQQLGHSLILTGEGGDSLKVRENRAVTTAYDFGTIYRTGWKSLAFGMSVNNFSREIKYEQENFELPLTFKIGASLDLLDLWTGRPAGMGLMLSVEALHPRDYPEQLNLGLEYQYQRMLYMRLGYMLVSDEAHVTIGGGLQKYGLGIDYAYVPFGVFDNVQMFTLHFGF